MLTILAMGQSNALGFGTGGVWGIPASVTVWNCAGNGNSGSVGNAFVAPVMGAAPFFPGKNNMMVHACRYLAAELNQNVRLILVSYGGQPISEWSAVNGPMYTRMKNVLTAANVSSVDAFLWHQGEANTPTYATYEAAWATLIGKMTSDGYINASTPIVIGDLACQPTSPNMNAVLRGLAEASARVSIADISCFQTNDMVVDIAHFNGISLVRAGLEYARELMKLPGAFNYTPSETDYPYVTAAGNTLYTATLGHVCPIRVKAENGNKTLIDSSGGFVADRLGAWEFTVSGFTNRDSLHIVLMDASGGIIQAVVGTSTDRHTSHLDGSTVLAMGKDDRAYMAVVQSSGSYAPVPALYSALLNRMTVKYLGRN